MGLNKSFEDVKKFHKAFNHPVSETPVLLKPERVAVRHSWLQEEIDEFVDAKTIADQADAMIDTIYFAVGTLVEMGVQPQELFEIVQAANMAKLWPDGKPHYNEHNKVIKPEGWEDPEPKLIAAIEKM